MPKIVRRIEEGTDRNGVDYTSYQMRNPFKQFADGVASELDVHCYFQHAIAADLCPENGKVLDVCCGRGLLIPFLRYRAKPSLYIGVDIEPSNAKWRDGWDPRRENIRTDWGFPRQFVEADVSTMSKQLTDQFDLIVYTSAIEHMRKEAQRLSLIECALIASRRGILYLTCPVSDKEGQEPQYAAHIYEPTMGELREWLTTAGWQVKEECGLCTKATIFKQVLSGPKLAFAERIYRQQPRELALSTIACLFPECATEMSLICQLRKR